MRSRRTLLSAGLALGSLAWLPRLGHGASAPAAFKAGAGRADVVFARELFALDGFDAQHDPLAVRVLLLDDGRLRLGIAVVDLTSIPDETVASMKALLTDITGVPAANAILCASHTFSAPHVFPADQVPGDTDATRNTACLNAFMAALDAAARQALASLQPARLGSGSGSSKQVNVNRDLQTPYGWWLGADEAGFVDPHLGVLRVDALDGRPLAVLMNFAVQSSIMDGSRLATGERLISADLAGAAASHVEAHYGHGAVALFLVGAAGDQAPLLQANRPVVHGDGSAGHVDLQEAGLALLPLLGRRLGEDVLRITEGLRMEAAPTLALRRASVSVPSQEFSPRNRAVGPVTSFQYAPAKPRQMPLVLMRIGQLCLVGMQPELGACLGASIRAGSPFAQTMVVTMVDGAAKYMPDASSYDRFTYEARSSPFGRGAGEAAVAAIIGQLKHMRGPRGATGE